MKYFKNAELVRLYNVSDKAVRNWIDGAQQGKFKLDLIEENGRAYIADSLNNGQALEVLAENGRKNMLTAGNDLLRSSFVYLDSLLTHYKNIQVVDIGVGNGFAARGLLEILHKNGKLRAYIGVDCSQKLLDITERNIQEWFAGDIPVRKILRDINYERFTDVLLDSSFNRNPSETATLLLFQGGTVGNFRSPAQALQTIRESMGENDLLLTTDKLDCENTRRFFDFNIETDIAALSQRNKMLLQLLSIDDSLYEVEQFFDKHYYARHIQVRLKFDVIINFKIENFEKSLYLRRGESILLFRMWEWTESELVSLYEGCGFSQLQMTKTQDEEYVLLISMVKTGPAQHPIKINPLGRLCAGG